LPLSAVAMAQRHKLLVTLCLFIPILSLAFDSPPEVDAQNKDELVRMTVAVWNRDGFVKGLGRDAFQITDGKIVRNVEFFEADDGPVSIGILVDITESMNSPYLRKSPNPSEDAIPSFLKRGHPDNEYFFATFDKSIHFVTDWTVAEDLLSRTTDIKQAKGYTAFYDACFAALEKMRSAHTSRRVLVLISDGLDNFSRKTFDQLRTELRRDDVVIYTVNLGKLIEGSSDVTDSHKILDELTEITGGRAFYRQSQKAVLEAFSMISDELQTQYRIGFRPSQMGAPGQWHRVKVKVVRPLNAPREFQKLTWRTRQGYYSK
jgi:Ca-activated chloride channel homolog